jgi:hypothetical protein
VGAYTFTLTDFPLVIIDAVGTITADQLRQHLREYRELVDRGEPYALVYDASKVSTPDATMRKEYAEFLKTYETKLKEVCLGGAFVISSTVVRGAFTAVLWITGGLPFPHNTFSQRTEAINWARQRLK